MGMKPQDGYAFVEVLVASVLLVTALVPLADALRESGRHAYLRQALVTQHYEARALLETVLTEPYAALEAEALATAGASPSSYSDTAGTVPRRVVWLAPYDIDNADGDDDISTGADTGVIRLVVETVNSGIRLETLHGESL